MRNSVVIVAVVLLAFIIFITMRGELVKYMATMGLAPKTVLGGA